MANKTIPQLTDGTATALDPSDLIEIWSVANARSEKKTVQQTATGTTFIFAAAANTVPTTSPAAKGMIAINESTNEQWFVNSSLTWQQSVGP